MRQQPLRLAKIDESPKEASFLIHLCCFRPLCSIPPYWTHPSGCSPVFWGYGSIITCDSNRRLETKQFLFFLSLSFSFIIYCMLPLLSHFSRVRSHRWQLTRLCCPWDSPGKNTGVGCHFLLQCMKVESESEVTESCPNLSDPMDCSPPSSSIHGIFQARVLERGAIAF